MLGLDPTVATYFFGDKTVPMPGETSPQAYAPRICSQS